MTSLTLIRSVARGLRYRSLDDLIGREVIITHVTTVEDPVRRALGAALPSACSLIGPEVHYRQGAVAKYGLLDLQFAAPRHLLGDESRSGVSLLRELGYLPRRNEDRSCFSRRDDPTCLDQLQEDLSKG
jgi:hypothetical protein